MHARMLWLLVALLAGWQAQAQESGQALRQDASPDAAARRFDALAAQRQLLTAPKSSPLPAPPPSAEAPSKDDETAALVPKPAVPQRVADSENSVILVQDQNQIHELPYVALPVPFAAGSAELPDAESRTMLAQLADVLKRVCAVNPDARFELEGYTTSEEGADGEAARTLAFARARQVFDELTLHQGVTAGVLSLHSPEGGIKPSPDRLLIVRTK